MEWMGLGCYVCVPSVVAVMTLHCIFKASVSQFGLSRHTPTDLSCLCYLCQSVVASQAEWTGLLHLTFFLLHLEAWMKSFSVSASTNFKCLLERMYALSSGFLLVSGRTWSGFLLVSGIARVTRWRLFPACDRCTSLFDHCWLIVLYWEP